MAGLKLSLFVLLLLALGPSQASPPCARLCEIRRTGSCPRLGEIMIVASGGALPCATCNMTGMADENPLGCLPYDLKKLQVAGHSDRSGELKPLPRLAQLRNLILGPGNIRTIERGAFEHVSGISALFLTKNAIKTVGSWFDGITKLQKLVLSWNEIKEIKENAFQPLRDLNYLELRHNQLRAVEESHFSSLTNLEYLHLSYNNISHIAGKSFDRLSRLHSLSLDHNKLSFLGTEWLQGLSAQFLRLNNNLISTIPAESLAAVCGRRRPVYIQENPFRCTCALSRASPSSHCLDNRDRMRCSYPPSLSGRKVDDVARGEMPCPPPAAKVSHRDRGTTLVCEVFWEKRPEIGWMDPRGRAVGDRQAQDRCGGTVTTRLEHDYPTTQSPEGGQVDPTHAPSLPYIGRSTSTLQMNRQAYLCWTGGSFRCVVKSATTGSVFEDLPLTKSSEQDPGHDHTVTTAAAYTLTTAQRNARVTERVAKTQDKNPRQDGITPAAEAGSMGQAKTNKPRQDGITPAADKAERRTVMTAVFTLKPTRQNGRVKENMSKATTKNGQQDGATPPAENPLHTMPMVFLYIITGLVGLMFLIMVRAAGRKCYKKRQERRQYLHGNAVAIVGIPLQNLQPLAAAPTTGNPVPPQQANDDIPDDASITPYAETSRLENPMYDADVMGPRGATSASPDPRTGPSRPANSRATSQPGGSGTAQAGNAPVPPPRSDKPGIAASDSHYYPPGTATTRAKDVPARPAETNRRVNPNVSAQAKRSGMSATRRNRSASCGSRRASYDNRRASYHKRRASYDSQVEGANLYLDLNGPPRHSGSDMPQAEDVNSSVSVHPKRLGTATLGMDEEENVDGPNLYLDLNGLKRHSGSNMSQAEDVNSSVSVHPKRLGTATLPRTRGHAYYDPRSLGTNEEENVDGPNLYLDLNGLKRHSGLEMPQAEDIPDPLPRTNRYVNSNVSAHPQESDMCQAQMIPDPLTRTRTYINCNISAQPHRLEMSAAPTNDEASYDNPRLFYDSRGTSYDSSGESYDKHGASYDNLRRASYDNHWASYDNRSACYDNHGASYDNLQRKTYVSTCTRFDMPQAERILDPLPRIHTYVNSNLSEHPQGSDMPQTERIPDPLPRIHTYVNSNVSARPQGPDMPQTERIPDPLPRIHTYVNSNVSPHPQGPDMPQTEKNPDPLPRIHTYVNSNVSARPQGPDMPQAERIPDPLPRIHTYVNSNVSAEPRRT
ncbi:hypothetical protein Bbelb_055980 [Branchiostoma belcheri]|nr:hypothetical protein Bbelb_055980 [Branchiostoma belcheri]